MQFYGKTIFSEHLKNISYFHVIFWERSSFIFCLKNKIIFSGKRNIIFPDDTRKIIFQCNFFGKTIFSEYLEKENMVFHSISRDVFLTILMWNPNWHYTHTDHISIKLAIYWFTCHIFTFLEEYSGFDILWLLSVFAFGTLLRSIAGLLGVQPLQVSRCRQLLVLWSLAIVFRH